MLRMDTDFSGVMKQLSSLSLQNLRDLENGLLLDDFDAMNEHIGKEKQYLEDVAKDYFLFRKNHGYKRGN